MANIPSSWLRSTEELGTVTVGDVKTVYESRRAAQEAGDSEREELTDGYTYFTGAYELEGGWIYHNQRVLTGAPPAPFSKGGLLGKVGTALGPSGNVFGRTRLGGSSLLGINSNNALRVGWGWVGSAKNGSHVFRISGDWVKRLGVKSGHIDLLKVSP